MSFWGFGSFGGLATIRTRYFRAHFDSLFTILRASQVHFDSLCSIFQAFRGHFDLLFVILRAFRGHLDLLFAMLQAFRGHFDPPFAMPLAFRGHSDSLFAMLSCFPGPLRPAIYRPFLCQLHSPFAVLRDFGATWTRDLPYFTPPEATSTCYL